MAQGWAVSPDGLWRISVDVFKINLIVYNALGATTRMYVRKDPRSAWYLTRADSISASASIGSSQYPNSYSALPPNVRRNDKEADCRAWSVGIGIKIFPNTGPASPPSTIADRVIGAGNATFRGLTLVVGPLTVY